jgi:hypothetical protein
MYSWNSIDRVGGLGPFWQLFCPHCYNLVINCEDVLCRYLSWFQVFTISSECKNKSTNFKPWRKWYTKIIWTKNKSIYKYISNKNRSLLFPHFFLSYFFTHFPNKKSLTSPKYKKLRSLPQNKKNHYLERRKKKTIHLSHSHSPTEP